MELYLIRHLKTTSDKAGAFYGSTDLDLEEPVNLVPCDSEHPFKLYSSPLKRCKKTAEHFFLDQEIELLEQAREVDFGEWEGLTFEEIAKQYPDFVDAWMNEDDFCFPKGESLKAFELRIKELASKILQSNHERVVLVSHGGVMRHLICEFLGLSFKQSLLFQIDLASLTKLQIFENGKGVLQGLGIREWQKYIL